MTTIDKGEKWAIYLTRICKYLPNPLLDVCESQISWNVKLLKDDDNIHSIQAFPVGEFGKLKIIFVMGADKPCLIASSKEGGIAEASFPALLMNDFDKFKDWIIARNNKHYPELIIKNNTKHYKYYYFMPEKHLCDVISKDELKATLPKLCNDPLEFLAAQQKEITKPGCFISFSSRFDSSPMWAHYADSHKGVCLEFSFPVLNVLTEFFNHNFNRRTTACELQLDNLQQYKAIYTKNEPVYKALMIEVIYSTKRPQYSSEISFALQTSNRIIDYAIAAEYYTKSMDWSYENEWRLMVTEENAGSVHDDQYFVTGLTKYLSKIILGKRFRLSDDIATAMIMESLKSNPHYISGDLSLPDVKRAEFDDEKYKIKL